MRTLKCDVAVIGGSLGGVAATIHLMRQASGLPLKIIQTSASDWLGGQISSQGVSALDEHAHIEQFGSTYTYAAFRRAIRQHYKSHFGVDTSNPGNGWVSKLCFLPEVGKDILTEQFAHADEILFGYQPSRAEVENNTIQSVIVTNDAGDTIRLEADFYLDATDLGDLLPLTQTAYGTGAEAKSDTNERGAPETARPQEIQSFTYCFAVEFCPGENHTIAKPAHYEFNRDNQPYTLTLPGHDGDAPIDYRFFIGNERNDLPFWTYRRIHDGTMLGGNDIALINWLGNDYYGGSIVDVPPETAQQHLEDAKQLSLGFLYWLQTECPRDEGGAGYPELKLRPDIMGTIDGLSKAPYVREGRRIISECRIVAQDIAAANHEGARARHFGDSVGLGWYPLDLHPCVGNPDISMFTPTKPFQIPLGALIPIETTNLIAACKNIGTTHLTNGAYRLHPIEWNIGEVAGLLASFCCINGCQPHAVYRDRWLLWRFQRVCVEHGIPLVWIDGIPEAYWATTQLLLVKDITLPQSNLWHHLDGFDIQAPIRGQIDIGQLQNLADDINQYLRQTLIDHNLSADMSWIDVCDLFEPAIDATLT
ncbi:MAG: hypothetical protein CL607_03290 [Anaerolineaceae bacterium]|nr:hypothetical protein [Anaerolineaceae bacterium]